MFSGSNRGDIRCHDIENGKLFGMIPNAHGGDILGIKESMGFLYTCGSDDTIKKWKLQEFFNSSFNNESNSVERGHNNNEVVPPIVQPTHNSIPQASMITPNVNINGNGNIYPTIGSTPMPIAFQNVMQPAVFAIPSNQPLQHIPIVYNILSNNQSISAEDIMYDEHRRVTQEMIKCQAQNKELTKKLEIVEEKLKSAQEEIRRLQNITQRSNAQNTIKKEIIELIQKTRIKEKNNEQK